MGEKLARIVFVDDGKMTLKLAEKILKNNGYTNINLFETGTEFLAHYENPIEPPPDIVFLDIKLPDTDGLKILEQARQAGKFSKTIFVSLSQYIQNIDANWLGYSGFDDILPKPLTEENLLNKIKNLINRRNDKKFEPKPPKDLEAALKELRELRFRTNELENKYIKKLISPEVFEKLDSGQDLAPKEQEVAIAFLDIRGFAKIINRVNDTKMNKILELLFDFACKCITKKNGFVDKFIGDAVMWFHKDDSIENSSKKCIEVAVDIMKGMKKLNEEIWEKIHTKVPIKIGIGAACGKVAVGIFGAPNYRIQYSALGSTVNLASRLCSKAKKDEIIIGDTIIEYCPYETVKKGFCRIKHFPHEIELRKIIIPKEN